MPRLNGFLSGFRRAIGQLAIIQTTCAYVWRSGRATVLFVRLDTLPTVCEGDPGPALRVNLSIRLCHLVSILLLVSSLCVGHAITHNHSFMIVYDTIDADNVIDVKQNDLCRPVDSSQSTPSDSLPLALPFMHTMVVLYRIS